MTRPHARALPPRYRVQLRIYGIDGQQMPVAIQASRDGESLAVTYGVGGPCSGSRTPCNSNAPSFLSLDLAREFPSFVGKGRFRIDIRSPQPWYSPRIWAFVTVTNNETQRVTVITPQ